MEKMYEIRTDLAVEAKESFPGDGGEIPGVVLEENYKEEAATKITKVWIKDEEGARAMRKPVGTYLTLETEALSDGVEENGPFADVLAEFIESLLPENWSSLLAVGLGNKDMTADSLGPEVVGRLWMTRHYSKDGSGISGIVPGVMAQTGMETADIVKGIVEETKPDVVLVIDALAARSVSRLGNTVQLTDTGIQPGSGVGNHRNGLNKESLGVPVIALGVPTVVGAATIACDTLEALIQVLKESQDTRETGERISGFSQQEKFGLVRELLEPQFGTMYVTPKDMDERIRRIGEMVAESVNLAVHSSIQSEREYNVTLTDQ